MASMARPRTYAAEPFTRLASKSEAAKHSVSMSFGMARKALGEVPKAWINESALVNVVHPFLDILQDGLKK